MGSFQVVFEFILAALVAAFVAQISAGVASSTLKWIGERFRFLNRKSNEEATTSTTTVPSTTSQSPQSPSTIGETTNPEVAEALRLLMKYYDELAAKQGGHPTFSPLPSQNNTALQLRTAAASYAVTHLIAEGDLSNVYRTTFNNHGVARQGVIKITRDPIDNDLVENEARVLQHLHSSNRIEDFGMFLPTVENTLQYTDKAGSPPRQVNVLAMHPDVTSPMELYNLEEVRQHHGKIDPRDMAWMWRRVLSILGFVHQNNVVHGAVLPTHILIEPVDHKLLLIDWSYAVHKPSDTNIIKAVSKPYEKWYPLEVFAKERPTPALDIYMAAQSMLYLLGLTPPIIASFAPMEPQLQRYFERCLASQPSKRPNDAWELLEEYDRIIESLWGERKFRPFSMPSKL